MPYKDSVLARQKARERYLRTRVSNRPYKPFEKSLVSKEDWEAGRSERHTAYKINKRLYVLVRRTEIREEAFKHYGKECLCCGETEIAFLSFDHLNNDGAAHRRELRPKNRPLGAGIAVDLMLRSLKKRGWPWDVVQILCLNCNLGRYKLGYCPHGQLCNN